MDGKPLKPSRARLDALPPSELLAWAVLCLGWARQDCVNHYIWEYYDDGVIVSVRGRPNQLDPRGSAICTDAAENALWIAFAAPPFGALVEHLLLAEANRLDGQPTWREAIDPYRIAALLVIDRYYDLVGADREGE